MEETKFRFCKNDGSFEVKQDNPDWNDGLGKAESLREIAYQLKRIADALTNKEENNK